MKEFLTELTEFEGNRINGISVKGKRQAAKLRGQVRSQVQLGNEGLVGLIPVVARSGIGRCIALIGRSFFGGGRIAELAALSIVADHQNEQRRDDDQQNDNRSEQGEQHMTHGAFPMRVLLHEARTQAEPLRARAESNHAKTREKRGGMKKLRAKNVELRTGLGANVLSSAFSVLSSNFYETIDLFEKSATLHELAGAI